MPTTTVTSPPSTSTGARAPGAAGFVEQAEVLLRSSIALERFAQLQCRLQDALTREGFELGEVRSLGVLTCDEGHVGLQGELMVTDPLWGSSFVVAHKLYVRDASLGGPKMYLHVAVASFDGPGIVTLSTGFRVSDLFRAEGDVWKYLEAMLAKMGAEPFPDEVECFGWFTNGLNDAMTP